jgi:glycosyltransferase involved in cell wall biosynthesis
MRIAFVQPVIREFGGIERGMKMYGRILGKKNEVGIFTTSMATECSQELTGLTVEGHLKRRDGVSLAEGFGLRGRLLSMSKSIQAWAPDVVVLQKEPKYCDWLRTQINRPIVFYAHDSQTVKHLIQEAAEQEDGTVLPWRWAYRRFASPRPFQRVNLASVALVICVSRSVEGTYLQAYPRLKTGVIYNGVDHEWFYPTWEDEGFCLCVSRFSKEKNLELIPRALGGAAYPTVIYGRSLKEKRAYFEALKRGSSGSIKIETHTTQERLRQLLQTCSVFLCPSPDEGWGQAPVEAMACGKAVVALNSGGILESVGEGGVLVGDDPGVWRETADRLMASEEFRKEYGRRAWERSKRYSWENTASEIERTLEEIVKR